MTPTASRFRSRAIGLMIWMTSSLDVFAEDGAGPPKPKKAASRRNDRPKENTDPRRHLAGADWLRDERPRELTES